ncbi:MAG TPA: DNA-3-methyladenine glycosylase [Mycobacteriales bacterium]
MSEPLPRGFFARPALEVARDLLGRVVCSRGVSVRLTEVEAYAGLDDPASHAYRGSTTRTAVMFGPPGHLYVYFVYGMHWCANLVCGTDGQAAAVLMRAGEVVDGLDTARARRPAARSDRELARGPARLASTLAFTGADSGTDLFDEAGRPGWLRVLPGTPVAEDLVRTGPRVGVVGAADWAWRLWVGDDPTVSRYQQATPRHKNDRRSGSGRGTAGGRDPGGRRVFTAELPTCARRERAPRWVVGADPARPGLPARCAVRWATDHLPPAGTRGHSPAFLTVKGPEDLWLGSVARCRRVATLGDRRSGVGVRRQSLVPILDMMTVGMSVSAALCTCDYLLTPRSRSSLAAPGGTPEGA